MPRISPKTLSLVADGKTIELKNTSKKNFELNKDLQDPMKFQEFVKDPKTFLSSYNFSVDDEISGALSKKLKGIKSLDELRKVGGLPDPIGQRGATVWAVAAGSYSVASSKIAVAF